MPDFWEKIGREIDTAVYYALATGWVRGKWSVVCACHGLPTYVQAGDYYAGYPSCRVTNQVIGPSQLKRVWVPPRKISDTAQDQCPFPMDPPEPDQGAAHTSQPTVLGTEPEDAG